MGVMSSVRCSVCGGTGYLMLDGQHSALYEWVEGYLDEDTSEEWLEDQLRRLLEVREEFLGKKGS